MSQLVEEVMCEEDFTLLMKRMELLHCRDDLIEFRSFFRDHSMQLAQNGLIYQRLSFARRVLVALDKLISHSQKVILHSDKRKKYISKSSIKIMRCWFMSNLHHPYPSEEQKRTFCSQLHLTMRQVTTWFINERNRKWDRSKFPSVTKYCSDKYKRKSRCDETA